MRLYARLALTALVATAAFATLVATASAARFEPSNQLVRVAWSSLEFEAGFNIRCGVTLEGSFHSRTIAKVVGSLIGLITRAAVRHPCTNGEAWAFNGSERLGATTLATSLPWHITYEGFTGTLPNIATLRILLSNARFRVQDPIFRLLCVYTTGAGRNATGTATVSAAGVVDRLVASSGAIASDTAGCPAGRFTSGAADGAITVLGTATRITVRLI
jgi:hypothetical protein